MSDVLQNPPPTYANPCVPSMADFMIFVRYDMGIAPIFLPDNSIWLTASYNMGLRNVYCLINYLDPPIFTAAVYNYAGDRLLHFAQDQPGQVYFADKRRGLNLIGYRAGLVQSSSDSGTSQSLLVADWAKNMTITQMEMMKTPYGRTYLGIAQEAGSNVWGLT